MSETKECPFCKSKAVVVCRVDSDWGVELKYKLLNDESNYDIKSMTEFENYDIDFQSGDYGDIYIYRCQSCRAEWGDGVDVDIADLKSRIAELESERRWIPVDENPAVSGIYLVQNIYDDIYPVKFDAKTETWELQNYDTIIHWTNIPELPEVER